MLPEDQRVDLIKLDIEGGEFEALLGAKRVIGKWRPALIFECGSEYYLKSQNLRRRDLYDLVTGEFGYEIFSFGDFLSNKGCLAFEEFLKCGLYPFRAFNFVAPAASRSKRVDCAIAKFVALGGATPQI